MLPLLAWLAGTERASGAPRRTRFVRDRSAQIGSRTSVPRTGAVHARRPWLAEGGLHWHHEVDPARSAPYEPPKTLTPQAATTEPGARTLLRDLRTIPNLVSIARIVFIYVGI